MIPPQGISRYQKWTQQQGIQIELSPTYTHELNSLSKRAGKEIIEKLIIIRAAVGLPEALWLEVT